MEGVPVTIWYINIVANCFDPAVVRGFLEKIGFMYDMSKEYAPVSESPHTSSERGLFLGVEQPPQKDLYQQLIEKAPIGIGLLSPDGEIMYPVNTRLSALVGSGEEPSLFTKDIVDPKMFSPLLRKFQEFQQNTAAVEQSIDIYINLNYEMILTMRYPKMTWM